MKDTFWSEVWIYLLLVSVINLVLFFNFQFIKRKSQMLDLLYSLQIKLVILLNNYFLQIIARSGHFLNFVLGSLLKN